MNVALWLAAGAFIGWAGFAFLKLNARRGATTSVLIGTAAGFLGGSLLAPMLSAATVFSGDFNPLSLFTACACAAACLVIGDMVYKRFGV